MAGRAAGLAVAAGGIAIANEALFAPLAGQGTPWSNLNWRLFPATAVLALTLSGLEKVTPGFATGLGGLAVLAVLLVPYGNAKPPIDNVLKVMGYR
jgi:hypothetical protein